MKSLKLTGTLTSLCLVMISHTTAHASVIWTGDPTKGLGVFKNINIQDAAGNYTSNPSPNGSRASATTDGTEGNVFTGETSFTGKTFDGSSVDPKWGIYGANNTHVIDYVSHLKIGTTYADVQPF